MACSASLVGGVALTSYNARADMSNVPAPFMVMLLYVLPLNALSGGVNLVYSLMGHFKNFPTLNQLIEYYVGHPAEFIDCTNKSREFGLIQAAPKGPSLSELMTTIRDKWKLIQFVVIPGGDPTLIEKGRREIRALRRSVEDGTSFQDALQSDAMAQAVNAFAGK